MVLTDADTLSLLVELRRRVEDPKNWGHGNASMKKAPHCVMGHLSEAAGVPGTTYNGLANYLPYDTDGELWAASEALVRGATNLGIPIKYQDSNGVFMLNDVLHLCGDHEGLLRWIDGSIQLVRERLGSPNINPCSVVDITVPGQLVPAP